MNRRLVARVLLGALLAVAGAAGAELTPGSSTRTLVHQGRERTFNLHVPPSYDGSTPVPLVLDFHGLGSDAVQQAAVSGQVALSDTYGFLLAHPQGLNHAWNAGICCGNAGIDDVGFIRGVVAAIVAAGNVDMHRVYATGLSNGGAISQRLACDAADLFAAAAPMAFPVPFIPLTGCQPSRPISVLSFMGITDVLVPYAGGIFPSAPDTFSFWHDTDACAGSTPDQTVTAGNSRCETYTSCGEGTEAGLCSIDAATYGGSPIDGHILYFNPDFVLSEVAWSFLSRFTLPADATAAQATLTGRTLSRIKGRGRKSHRTAWSLVLNDGTWSAVDADGDVLGGTWVPRGKGGRDLVLTLSDTDRDALLADLAGDGAPVAAAGAERLHAHLNRRRTRVTLKGALRLVTADGGKRAGRWTLTARGKIAGMS
jgi:polyhydroxybutyrate depolymerase